MNDFLANLLLYAPPLLCGVLYYLRERKKQANARQQNPILLYILPFVIFAGATCLWSLAVGGILSLVG